MYRQALEWLIHWRWQMKKAATACRPWYLACQEGRFPDMDIVCEGSKELLNQYGVIAVNPEKYPDVNNEAANTFIKWICSPEIRTLIGEYGVKEYGEPLFFPNAEQK